MNIAVAGTGYVGLSLAVLLAQHNKVTAVDIIPEKVEKLNNCISPIQDEYIEKYLAEAKAGARTLDLTATTDGASAYASADFVIIAAPTNYDPQAPYDKGMITKDERDRMTNRINARGRADATKGKRREECH